MSNARAKRNTWETPTSDNLLNHRRYKRLSPSRTRQCSCSIIQHRARARGEGRVDQGVLTLLVVVSAEVDLTDDRNQMNKST